MTEQDTQIKRVRERIAPTVVEFCCTHVGECFYMEQLTRFVRSKLGIAPDSPGRILRDLRQKGVVDYEVVSRSESLYRVK